MTGSVVYGTHLMLRLNQVQDRTFLSDAEAIAEFLVTLVKSLQMRILDGPRIVAEAGADHKRGLSGIVILHESHAAMHTYPGLGEAFLDVFSCKSYDVESVLSLCRERLGLFVIAEQATLDRGRHWGSSGDAQMKDWLASR